MAMRVATVTGVGLQNQGATCYLNSLLQTLFYLDCFRVALYHIPISLPTAPEVSSSEEEQAPPSADPLRIYGGIEEAAPVRPRKKKRKPEVPQDKETEKRTIIEALQRLFFRLQQPGAVAQTTNELTKAFGWGVGGEMVRQQQDVGELNRMLLDLISEKLKRIGEADFVKSLFCGTVERSLHAVNVPAAAAARFVTKVRQEEFYEIHLIVKDHPSFDSAMRHYLAPESISDFRWEFDDGTEETAQADIEVVRGFSELPSILTIHLTRFDYDPELDRMVKIASPLEFPVSFDASQYLAQSSADRGGSENDYVLYAALIHRGSINIGHYFCYICPDPAAEERVWHCFNDDTVTTVAEAEVLANGAGLPRGAPGARWGAAYGAQQTNAAFGTSTNAYMLVYLRRRDIPTIIFDETKKHSADPPEHLVTMLREEMIRDAKELARPHERLNWAHLLVSTAGMAGVGRVEISHSVTSPPTVPSPDLRETPLFMRPADVTAPIVTDFGSLDTRRGRRDKADKEKGLSRMPRELELMVRRTTTVHELKVAVAYRLLRAAGFDVPPPTETMKITLHSGRPAAAAAAAGANNADDVNNAATNGDGSGAGAVAEVQEDAIDVDVPWLSLCGPPAGWDITALSKEGWQVLNAFGLGRDIARWRLWAARPFIRPRAPISEAPGLLAGMTPLSPCYYDEQLYLEALQTADGKPLYLPPQAAAMNIVPLEAMGVRPSVCPFKPFFVGAVNSYTGIWRWALPLSLFPQRSVSLDRIYSEQFGGWGPEGPPPPPTDPERAIRQLSAQETSDRAPNIFQLMLYEQGINSRFLSLFLAVPDTVNNDPNYALHLHHTLSVLCQRPHFSYYKPIEWRVFSRSRYRTLGERDQHHLDHGYKEMAPMETLNEPSNGFIWWLPSAAIPPNFYFGKQNADSVRGDSHIPCLMVQVIIVNFTLAQQQGMSVTHYNSHNNPHTVHYGAPTERLRVPGFETVSAHVAAPPTDDGTVTHPLEPWFPGISDIPPSDCAAKPILIPRTQPAAAAMSDEVPTPAPLGAFDNASVAVCLGPRYGNSTIDLFVQDTAAPASGPIECQAPFATPPPPPPLYDKTTTLLNVRVFSVDTQELFNVGRAFYPTHLTVAAVVRDALRTLGLAIRTDDPMLVFEDRFASHVGWGATPIHEVDRVLGAIASVPPCSADPDGKQASSHLRRFRAMAATLCGYGAVEGASLQALEEVLQRIESIVPREPHNARARGRGISSLRTPSSASETAARIVPIDLSIPRAGLVDGSALLIQIGHPDPEWHKASPPPLSDHVVDPRRRSVVDALLAVPQTRTVRLVHVSPEPPVRDGAIAAASAPRMLAPLDVEDGYIVDVPHMDNGENSPVAAAKMLEVKFAPAVPPYSGMPWLQWHIAKQLGLEGNAWRGVRLYSVRRNCVAVPACEDDLHSDGLHRIFGYDIRPPQPILAQDDNASPSELVAVVGPYGLTHIPVKAQDTAADVFNNYEAFHTAAGRPKITGPHFVIPTDPVNRAPTALFFGPGAECDRDGLYRLGIHCVQPCDIQLFGSNLPPGAPETVFAFYIVPLPKTYRIPLRLTRRNRRRNHHNNGRVNNAGLYDDDEMRDDDGSEPTHAALDDELEPHASMSDDDNAQEGWTPDRRWGHSVSQIPSRYPAIVVRTERHKPGVIGRPFIVILKTGDRAEAATERIRLTWAAIQRAAAASAAPAGVPASAAAGAAGTAGGAHGVAPWSAEDKVGWEFCLMQMYRGDTPHIDDYEVFTGHKDGIVELLMETDQQYHRTPSRMPRTMRCLAVRRLGTPTDVQPKVIRERETGIVLKAKE